MDCGFTPTTASQIGAPGYYKFRCRNFFTHNCGNWVYVNYSVCGECVAAKREDSAHAERASDFQALNGSGVPRPSPALPVPRKQIRLFSDDDINEAAADSDDDFDAGL